MAVLVKWAKAHPVDGENALDISVRICVVPEKHKDLTFDTTSVFVHIPEETLEGTETYPWQTLTTRVAVPG